MTKEQQIELLLSELGNELAYMQRKVEEAKEPRDLHYMGRVAAIRWMINVSELLSELDYMQRKVEHIRQELDLLRLPPEA